MARASSLRPAPISPNIPTISPLRSEKPTSCSTRPRLRPSTRSTHSPGRFSTYGNSCSSFRPTIIEIIFSLFISAMGHWPMTLPSRITATSSHSARTSSRVWEM